MGNISSKRNESLTTNIATDNQAKPARSKGSASAKIGVESKASTSKKTLIDLPNDLIIKISESFDPATTIRARAAHSELRNVIAPPSENAKQEARVSLALQKIQALAVEIRAPSAAIKKYIQFSRYVSLDFHIKQICPTRDWTGRLNANISALSRSEQKTAIRQWRAARVALRKALKNPSDELFQAIKFHDRINGALNGAAAVYKNAPAEMQKKIVGAVSQLEGTISGKGLNENFYPVGQSPFLPELDGQSRSNRRPAVAYFVGSGRTHDKHFTTAININDLSSIYVDPEAVLRADSVQTAVALSSRIHKVYGDSSNWKKVQFGMPVCVVPSVEPNEQRNIGARKKSTIVVCLFTEATQKLKAQGRL